TQRQPADTAMIKLNELAIGLRALRLAHGEVVFLRRLVPQVFVERCKSSRAIAVRSALDLQLQQTHLDAHLNQRTGVLSAPHADAHRLWFVRPITEDAVDVGMAWHIGKVAVIVQSFGGNWTSSCGCARESPFTHASHPQWHYAALRKKMLVTLPFSLPVLAADVVVSLTT